MACWPEFAPGDSASGIVGFRGPKVVDFLLLLVCGKVFPGDSVAILVFRERRCGWVFPAQVTKCAWGFCGFSDGEVEGFGAPQCVFAGDGLAGRFPQAVAVVRDGCIHVLD